MAERCMMRCTECVLWTHWLAHDDASGVCIIWQQLLQRLFWSECACSGLCPVVGYCTGCTCSDACCWMLHWMHMLRCMLLVAFVGCAWSDVCHIAEFAGCMCSDVCCAPCSMGIETRHAWGMTETSPIGTSGCLKVHLSASAQQPLHSSICIRV